MRIYQKGLTLGVMVTLLATLCLGCGSTKPAAQTAEDLGDSGKNWAIELAQAHPFRSAYSNGEQEMAADLEARLKQLGVEPIRQTVNTGGGQADNLLVRKPGRGFYRDIPQATDVAGQPDANQQTGDFRQLVILAAPYGTPLSETQAQENPGYEGISGNASGTALLLKLIEQTQGHDYGYDIDFVFLAASGDQHAGAQAYVDALPEDQRSQVAGVFVFDSIYAGDKLYANAGLQAAYKEKRERLRRPLYDILSVSVSYYTGQRLYDNQAGYEVKLPGSDEQVIYREFTLEPGDHQPFDQADLPVVLIESGDYHLEQGEAFRESKNPLFDETKGRIRGTRFDNYSVLKEALPENQLQERLNALVFWMLKYLDQGVYNAKVK